MELTFSLNDIFLFIIALFSMFGPFAVIGPFVALTADYKRSTQKKIAFRVSLLLGIMLILLSLLGNYLLMALGISLASLSAAGGLVLIVSALNMAIKGDSPRRKVKADDIDEDDDDWETITVTPILFPITFGAGTMSLVMTQSAIAVTLLDKLVLCGVFIFNSLGVYLVYFFAGPLSKAIGNRGNAILTRVGGIILLSLAFKIFTRGLLELLPGLG